MQSQEKSFLAFFSYVQENDKIDGGRLTFLRKSLQAEIWAQTGKPFSIFQDTENIEWGQDWKERIKKALDASSLLIAIITPSYLVSPSCRFEFEYFLKREALLKRKLILPILYIDAPKLNDKNDNIAVEISKRQWVDWKDLRFASLTSAKVNKKVESLAKQIRKLIDEKIFEDINTEFENKYSLPDSVIRKKVVRESVDASGYPDDKPTLLYAPIKQEKDSTQSLQHINVLIRPTRDWERNKRRIKIVHSTLISYKGRDRFSLQIIDNGKSHLIDFPNDTTYVCPELLDSLRKLLGENSWHIEEIIFE